jgi:hypothetical protein
LAILAREQTGIMKTMTLQRAKYARINCKTAEIDSIRFARQDWRGFPAKSCNRKLQTKSKSDIAFQCTFVHFGGWRKSGPNQWTTIFFENQNMSTLMDAADVPLGRTKAIANNIKIDCKSALFTINKSTRTSRFDMDLNRLAGLRQDAETSTFQSWAVPDAGSRWEEIVISLCDHR